MASGWPREDNEELDKVLDGDDKSLEQSSAELEKELDFLDVTVKKSILLIDRLKEENRQLKEDIRQLKETLLWNKH